MKVAFLFAGQGAQAVGMGKDLFEAFPEVRAIYEAGSDAVGIDLAAVSFEGPLKELTRTDVAQPAIVAASLAALTVLRARQPELEPVACAGLSLGEYTALVAADALDASSALRLVSLRGRFMQEACDARAGAMASVIGLAPAAIEACLREAAVDAEPLVIANYNSPRQTVISGAKAAVARALAPLKAAGARKVVPLTVAGAYHSPLMDAARSQLRPHLDAARLAAPRIPVYANVSARPHGGADEIRDLLAAQITAPVRFSETIEALRSAGVEAFYELGPGGVLKGLCRQIDRKAPCTSLMGLESFDAAGIPEVATR